MTSIKQEDMEESTLAAKKLRLKSLISEFITSRNVKDSIAELNQIDPVATHELSDILFESMISASEKPTNWRMPEELVDRMNKVFQFRNIELLSAYILAINGFIRELVYEIYDSPKFSIDQKIIYLGDFIEIYSDLRFRLGQSMDVLFADIKIEYVKELRDRLISKSSSGSGYSTNPGKKLGTHNDTKLEDNGVNEQQGKKKKSKPEKYPTFESQFLNPKIITSLMTLLRPNLDIDTKYISENGTWICEIYKLLGFVDALIDQDIIKHKDWGITGRNASNFFKREVSGSSWRNTDYNYRRSDAKNNFIPDIRTIVDEFKSNISK